MNENNKLALPGYFTKLSDFKISMRKLFIIEFSISVREVLTAFRLRKLMENECFILYIEIEYR